MLIDLAKSVVDFAATQVGHQVEILPMRAVSAVEKLGSAAGAAADAVGTAADAIVTAGDTVYGFIDQHILQTDQKYMSMRPDNAFLYVRISNSESDAGVLVLDTEGNMPYIVEGEFNESSLDLRVMSQDGNEVGRVRKDPVAILLSVLQGILPISFSVFQDGEHIATVEAKRSSQGHRYNVKPHGWCIQPVSAVASDYSTVHDGDVLFNISRRSGYKTRVYLIDYASDLDGGLELLMALSVIYCETYEFEG